MGTCRSNPDFKTSSDLVGASGKRRPALKIRVNCYQLFHQRLAEKQQKPSFKEIYHLEQISVSITHESMSCFYYVYLLSKST